MFSLDDYNNAECPLMQETPYMFVQIYRMTNGNVCDTGCYAYGHCKACDRLHPTNHSPKNKYPETVRQEAARRGLGIREVRRQRRDKNNIDK